MVSVTFMTLNLRHAGLAFVIMLLSGINRLKGVETPCVMMGKIRGKYKRYGELKFNIVKAEEMPRLRLRSRRRYFRLYQAIEGLKPEQAIKVEVSEREEARAITKAVKYKFPNSIAGYIPSVNGYLVIIFKEV